MCKASVDPKILLIATQTEKLWKGPRKRQSGKEEDIEHIDWNLEVLDGKVVG